MNGNKGMRLFRVGVVGPGYFARKSVPKILSIITNHVPEAVVHRSAGVDGAEVDEIGSNYVLIIAPKESLPALETACGELNKKVSLGSEECKRRGIRLKKKK